MAVADNLASSHAAHLAYREALTRNDQAGARMSLQVALDTRLAAQVEDPQFEDAAWRTESGQYPHVALVVFYRGELAK